MACKEARRGAMLVRMRGMEVIVKAIVAGRRRSERRQLAAGWT